MESISDQPAAGVDTARPRGFFRARRLLFVADVLSAAIAGWLPYVILRERGTFSQLTEVTAIVVVLVIIFTMGLLMRAGQYAERRRIAPLYEMGVLLRNLVVAAAATLLLSYLTKGFFTGFTTPSRIAVGSFLLAFFLLGAASRAGLSAYQRHLFAQGRAVRKILVFGTGEAAGDFMEFVENRPWLGVVVAGRLAYGRRSTDVSGDSRDSRGAAAPVADTADSDSAGGDCPPCGLPMTYVTNTIPGLKRLDDMLRASGAVEVVVALDPDDEPRLSKVANLLSLAHVPFKVIPSLFEQSYRATELLGYGEIPVIDVEVDSLDRMARLFKRTLDICVAVTAFVLLLPLEFVTVIAIAVESGFPLIYRQERVGKNARHFQMYKFRTMVKDADQHLAELAGMNEAGADGRMFKIRHDPRVTRVGRVLRRFSIDELPQLLNVLKKDMSVVGPRPPLPAEVELYAEEHIYRLKALPGITGLWQVSGRSDLDFEGMVKLDRYYLDNWSLSLDIKILLKTLLVLVSRKGAY